MPNFYYIDMLFKRLNFFRHRLKPLPIFYLFMLYVLTFFIWWTVFHFESIKEIHNLYIEKAELVDRFTQLDPNNQQNSQLAIDRANIKYRSSRNMILGEGAVFFIILLIAAYWIHRGFKRELILNAQQRNFMLSITHELKSPLAGIRLSTETMLSRILDHQRQKKLLQNALKDTERLQNLVENILTAAKLENQSMELDLAAIEWSSIIDDISHELIETLGQQRQFALDIEPNIWVHGDRMALISIVTNLVENAIKYTENRGKIAISLKSADNLAQLIVADTGKGIADVEKNKIFQKFYRIGSEETRRTKGTGLGLFLVEQLVAMHNGKIKITDNVPNGSVFVVEMPCFKTNTTDTDNDARHNYDEELEFDHDAYEWERLG